MPLAGYCRNTDGEGDCSRGDAGAWETRKHALTSLQACWLGLGLGLGLGLVTLAHLAAGVRRQVPRLRALHRRLLLAAAARLLLVPPEP